MRLWIPLLFALSLAPSAFAQAPLPPTVDSDDVCGAAIAHYLEVRAAMNHCEVANDCAEMYPGVCPQGPYYIDARSDMAPLRAAIAVIDAYCVLPECEPPMPLGPARCVDGTCVEGVIPDDTCWTFDVRYMEHGVATSIQQVEALTPTSPRNALGLAEAREVELHLTDHTGAVMADHTLLHSAHNSARLSAVDPAEPGLYRLSLDAGVHYFAVTGPAGSYLRLTATWAPSDEVTTHHAEVHMRVCED